MIFNYPTIEKLAAFISSSDELEKSKLTEYYIKPNKKDLGLIFQTADFAVQCAMDGKSGVVGLDENNNIKKVLIYPKKSKAMNIAFDVTPAKYVTGLITEKGVCEASTEGLKKLFK